MKSELLGGGSIFHAQELGRNHESAYSTEHWKHWDKQICAHVNLGSFKG